MLEDAATVDDVKESLSSTVKEPAVIEPPATIKPVFNHYQLIGDSQFLRFAVSLLGCEREERDGFSLLGLCVSGQRIEHLLDRVRTGFADVSEKIVLMIGTNNLLYGTSFEEMRDDLKELLRLLSQNAKKIILLTLPPVPKLEKDKDHWDRLKKFNKFIKTLDVDEKIFVGDVYAEFVIPKVSSDTSSTNNPDLVKSRRSVESMTWHRPKCDTVSSNDDKITPISPKRPRLKLPDHEVSSSPQKVAQSPRCLLNSGSENEDYHPRAVKQLDSSVTAIPMVDGVPTMADVEVPTVVDVEVPKEIDVDVPTLVDVEVPTVVDVEVPKEVNFEVPTMIDVEVPTLVDVEVPKKVDVEVPEKVDVEVSTMIDVQVPTVVDEEVPMVFDVEVPREIDLEVPTMIDVEVPTVVDVEVPTTVDVQVPTVVDFGVLRDLLSDSTPVPSVGPVVVVSYSCDSMSPSSASPKSLGCAEPLFSNNAAEPADNAKSPHLGGSASSSDYLISDGVKSHSSNGGTVSLPGSAITGSGDSLASFGDNKRQFADSKSEFGDPTLLSNNTVTLSRALSPSCDAVSHSDEAVSRSDEAAAPSSETTPSSGVVLGSGITAPILSVGESTRSPRSEEMFAALSKKKLRRKRKSEPIWRGDDHCIASSDEIEIENAEKIREEYFERYYDNNCRRPDRIHLNTAGLGVVQRIIQNIMDNLDEMESQA